MPLRSHGGVYVATPRRDEEVSTDGATASRKRIGSAWALYLFTRFLSADR